MAASGHRYDLRGSCRLLRGKQRIVPAAPRLRSSQAAGFPAGPAEEATPHPRMPVLSRTVRSAALSS